MEVSLLILFYFLKVNTMNNLVCILLDASVYKIYTIVSKYVYCICACIYIYIKYIVYVCMVYIVMHTIQYIVHIYNIFN